MNKLVHLVGRWYKTPCGKDTSKWKYRAERTTNHINKVTCTMCLCEEAFSIMQRLNYIQARNTRETIAYFEQQYDAAKDGPHTVEAEDEEIA